MHIGNAIPARLCIDSTGEYDARVHCGARDCGTYVGLIDHVRPGAIGLIEPTGPPRVAVELSPGFACDARGVWTLTARAEKQWQRAKRAGIPWGYFLKRGRRATSHARCGNWRELHAHVELYGDRCPICRRRMFEPAPVFYPTGAFRFRCPVCRWVNVAEQLCDRHADCTAGAGDAVTL